MGNVDGIILLEVTQNNYSRSLSFADEVIEWAFSYFSKIRLLRFLCERTPRQMSCLRQDILCDLWVNFQTKRSDLRI